MKLFRILPFFFLFSFSLQGGLVDAVRSALGMTHYASLPKIDVLICKEVDQPMIEIKGKYHIYDPNTKKRLASRIRSRSRPLIPLSSGLKWGEEFPGVYQLHLVPDNESITIVVNGKEYRGSLFIYQIEEKISVVNRVNIEDYLLAVLPKFYTHSRSRETLAAAAIVERTCAVYQATHPVNRFWAVDGEHVGYTGIERDAAVSEIGSAIIGTSHMVMSQMRARKEEPTPFPARWSYETIMPLSSQPIQAVITLEDAEHLSQQGKHAAQILKRAFPDTQIELIY